MKLIKYFLGLFILICLIFSGFSALPFWIEHDENNNPSGYLWTKLNLTANGSKIIYIKKNGSYISDGDAVFEFFDDFRDSSLDSNKWKTLQGTVTVSNDKLILTGTTSTRGIVESLTDFNPNVITEGYIMSTSRNSVHPFTMRTSGDWSNKAFDVNYGGTNSIFETSLSNSITTTIITSYVNTSTYYKFKNIWKNGSSSLYINNILRANHTTNVPSSSQVIVFQEGSSTGTGYIDYIFVRKYATNESTISITDIGDYYKVTVTNNEATDLTDYQVGIPISQLPAITSTSQMLSIIDYELKFTNISANNIENFNNTFFNTSKINFNLTVTAIETNININLTYYLYNSTDLVSSKTYQPNNINGNITYFNFSLLLEDGNYSISFFAWNNETNISTGNYTFAIDTTPPFINNNIPSEINSYQFLADYFSCSDDNLETCKINIDGQEVSQGINITLTHNGYLSYTITATDLAGNINNVTRILFVNPYMTFKFYDIVNEIYVSNYSFGGFHTDDEVLQIKIYDLGLGEKTLSFEKLGYVSTDFTLTLTNTSNINTTYNVIPARIEFYVYDDVTNQLITNQTIYLDIIGDVSLRTNTTDGIFNITSIVIPGQYQAKVTTDNYISTEKTFTFNANEILTSNFYLIPVNYSLAGYVEIVTYNSDNTYASDVTVTASKWVPDSSSFIETFRTRSNPNGVAIIPIILEDELYRFCALYDTGEVCFPEGSIGQSFSRAQNGERIPILQDISFPVVPKDFINLQFTLLDSTVSNYSDDYIEYNISYSWVTNDGSDATVCHLLEKNLNFTTTSVTSFNCTTTSSGTFTHRFLLNSSYNYKFTAYQLNNDGSKTNLYIENIYGNENLFNILDKFNISIFIKILIVAVMVGVIPFLKYPLLIVTDVIIVVLLMWQYIIPQSIGIRTVGTIIVMAVVTLWGVSRR